MSVRIRKNCSSFRRMRCAIFANRLPAPSPSVLTVLTSFRFYLNAIHFIWRAVTPPLARRALSSPLLERHGIADGGSVENNGAVAPRNGCQKLCDGFVLADFGHFNSTCYRVAGPHWSAKIPIDVEKHGARARQVLGNDGVQNRAGDSSLHHDSAETCRLCNLLIIV